MAVSDTATESAAIGPPPATTGFLGWMRKNLFSNVWNTLLTIVCAYLIIRIVPPLVSWLFLDATWGEAAPQQCRAAEGACWAFVTEKHRVILFGRYPFLEHWRPLLGICVLLTVVLTSCFRRCWRPWIALVWIGGLGAFFVLMFGGDVPIGLRAAAAAAAGAFLIATLRSSGSTRSLLFGATALFALLALAAGPIFRVIDGVLNAAFGTGPLLAGATGIWFEIPTGLGFVSTSLWGGLPLTLLLSILGIVVAFPLAILLALGRRSKMPLIRMFCVGYIEVIRGVPLISLLFVGSFLLPLFLPRGVEISDLLRAQVAIIGFSAAYLAEVIRGGLQAIPRGQFEAADALGLSYWQKMAKIVLPQAITIVIPPIVNTFIGLFKDTSLVSIVSLTDLLLATKDIALADVDWRAFYAEGYAFIALIYFVFCFFMSKYSQYLERQFETGRQKRR
ncbi:MAG: amino acid ABC transporter permease [Candidatus Odyssella sp.]|nr:amino acid ABC transporter permease [Candidatus Odyssella sp.]